MSRMIQKIKILIIDDDKNLCENLVKIFNYEGYIAKYTLDSLKGLKLIQSENFHIIILDLKMPRMNGVEVLKKIKELNIKLGVIILTGYPSIDTAIETLKNQAVDYITKPFKNESLIKAIKHTAKKLGLIEDPFKRLNIHIGQNIKAYRMRKNFTIRKLAERTALSVGMISQIENGKNAASILTLYKIAQILEVDLCEFVRNI